MVDFTIAAFADDVGAADTNDLSILISATGRSRRWVNEE
jgi:hypothetical protein